MEVISEMKVEESACAPLPSTVVPDLSDALPPSTTLPKEPSAFRADAPSFVPLGPAFRVDAPTFVPQAAPAGVGALSVIADSDMGTMRQFEELEALLETGHDCPGPSLSPDSESTKDSLNFRADAPAFSPRPSSGLHSSHASPEASHSISIFEQLWSPAEAVPSSLKELWVPAQAAAPLPLWPGSRPGAEADGEATASASAAAASMVRLQESSGFRADAPTFIPQAHLVSAPSLGGPCDAYMHSFGSAWASPPPLGVLENPLLATPPPRGGYGAYCEDLPDTPEKGVPFAAPNFIVARAHLLTIRNVMGRRPIPKDLKVRATFPDPAGGLVPGHFPELADDEPTTGNAVAGALLLSLVRGEPCPDMSKDGGEQGAAIMSLFKSQQNGYRYKKDFTAPNAAATAANGWREQRPLPGVNGAHTAGVNGNSRAPVPSKLKTGPAPAPVSATPSRAEIRKAAAAARELEKSSKVDPDGASEKVKAAGSDAAEADSPKEKSTGRSRNAKRAPPREFVQDIQVQ